VAAAAHPNINREGIVMRENRGDGKTISRSGFLNLLSRIGLLSLIMGVPAFSAERAQTREAAEEETKPGGLELHRMRCAKLAQSPMIKGKTLSRTALDADLATRDLENIRDLLTGRFFGKVADEVFEGGYVPLINWDLGMEGGDSGCFLHANMGSDGSEVGAIANCAAYLHTNKDLDHIIISLGLSSKFGDASAPCQEQCPMHCSCYSVCPNQSNASFHDFVSYPSDKFVSEITGILKTTDFKAIRDELKAVIFSDEALNMGLRHFISAAHEKLAEGIEST
jgi:hypothetical protein